MKLKLVSKVQGFTSQHSFGCNNVSAVRVGQDETRPNDHCPTTPPLIILGGRRAIAMDRYSEKRPSTTCALVQLSSLSVQIGRASCRERVCQYVLISVVAVSLHKKTDDPF